MLPGELIPCASVWHDPGITPCCKSLRADAVELEFKTIEFGAPALLNQCCLFVLDFESMFRAGMVKMLLQQYLPKRTSCTAAKVVHLK